MIYAVDKNGNRVSAFDADYKTKYFCPVCGEEVLQRHGDIKIDHFAHLPSRDCSDRWNYDMSEWHKSMQNLFDEKYQEVTLTVEGETHRADVLKDGVVIEFQHSPISLQEFDDRNFFYRSAGYKIMWVFDLQDAWDSGHIVYSENKNNTFRWKWPLQVLKGCPDLHEYDKDFQLWVTWVENEYDEEEYYRAMHRIIWSTKDEFGDQNFKYFLTSPWTFELKHNLDVKRAMMTNADVLKEHLKGKPSYKVKKMFVKGFPMQAYVCPKRNEFGLNLYGNDACRYCEHCTAINKLWKGYDVYCCYPEKVHEEYYDIFENI